MMVFGSTLGATTQHIKFYGVFHQTKLVRFVTKHLNLSRGKVWQFQQSVLTTLQMSASLFMDGRTAKARGLLRNRNHTTRSIHAYLDACQATGSLKWVRQVGV